MKTMADSNPLKWSMEECKESCYTSQDLLEHLKVVEGDSQGDEQYYALTEDCLDGIIVKAKTAYGAVLKIYTYMQDNKIPLWQGPKGGECNFGVEDLIYGEPISTLDRFQDLCDDWIADYTVTYSKIVII